MECGQDESAIDDEITFLLRLRPSPTISMRRSLDFKKSNTNSRVANGWDVIIERKEEKTPSPPPIPPRSIHLNSLQPSAPPQETAEHQSASYISVPYQQFYQRAYLNGGSLTNLVYGEQTNNASHFTPIDQDNNTSMITHLERPTPFVTNHDRYVTVQEAQLIANFPVYEGVPLSNGVMTHSVLNTPGKNLIQSVGQQQTDRTNFHERTLSCTLMKPPKQNSILSLTTNNYTLPNKKEDIIDVQSDEAVKLLNTDEE
ncbi:hypothetical protein FQA39_LY02072 [Lamprigera yunnana]|nr:hypothetical protein FQA39_LY02072 [Lamprigera yunnana]